MIRSGKVIFLVFGTLSLSISLLGCSTNLEGQNESGGHGPGRTQAARQNPDNRGATVEAVPVEARSPWRSDLASYIFGNANIEALREVEIIARVDGLLEHLAVEEGDLVTRGEVLAELDKSEFKISLQEAEALLENNRSLYERASKMVEQELTSREAFDRSKYDYQTAKAQLERQQLKLRYATITAPFTGVITRRIVEQGDMIRTGSVLFNLSDIEKLLVRVYVPEKNIGRILIGNTARIESEMFLGENFTGVVELIAPAVDPASGTVKVSVRITEGRKLLKPGMFCSVYILIDTHKDALVISRKALIPETESPEVFVIDDSSVVYRRKITIGILQGDTLEVLEGLSESDRVVLIGQEGLREGTLVEIAEEETSSVKEPTPPDRK